MVAHDGRERRLLTVQPGEMFGELCFCDIRARQDQAAVLQESEVVALRTDDLLAALLASPEGAAAMLGTLCARVSDAQDQLQRLAFHTVPQRVGLLLLAQAGSAAPAPGGGLRSPENPVLNLGEEMHAVLLLLGQGNRLPGHGPRVTDSLTR